MSAYLDAFLGSDAGGSAPYSGASASGKVTSGIFQVGKGNSATQTETPNEPSNAYYPPPPINKDAILLIGLGVVGLVGVLLILNSLKK